MNLFKKYNLPIPVITTAMIFSVLLFCHGFYSSLTTEYYAYTLYPLVNGNTSQQLPTGTIFAPTPFYHTDPPDIISPLTLIHTVLSMEHSDQYQNPFPTGVAVYSMTLNGTLLALEFSPEYGELSGIRRTAADYALTLALTQLPQIESVTIHVFGQEQTELTLSPQDLVHSDLLAFNAIG